jgi:hypothetical protein
LDVVGHLDRVGHGAYAAVPDSVAPEVIVPGTIPACLLTGTESGALALAKLSLEPNRTGNPRGI